jgi:hypothetical protein
MGCISVGVMRMRLSHFPKRKNFRKCIFFHPENPTPFPKMSQKHQKDFAQQSTCNEKDEISLNEQQQQKRPTTIPKMTYKQRNAQQPLKRILNLNEFIDPF